MDTLVIGHQSYAVPILYINSADVESDLKLFVKGIRVAVVKQFEYLGIIIDDRLQMNEYVDHIYEMARQKLGILYKIRKFTKIDTALLLYKVMIRPYVEY